MFALKEEEDGGRDCQLFFLLLSHLVQKTKERAEKGGRPDPTHRPTEDEGPDEGGGVRSSKTGTARPPPKAGFIFFARGAIANPTPLRPKRKGQSAPHVLLIRPDSGGGPFTMQVYRQEKLI